MYPIDEIEEAFDFTWADLSGSQHHNHNKKKLFFYVLDRVHKRNKENVK